MKKLLRSCLYITFSFFIFSSHSVVASNGDPIQLLKTSSNQILGSLYAKRASLKSDPRYIDKVLKQYLIPIVNVEGMARSAVGGQAWSKASDAQRNFFIKEFTDLVISSYAEVLTGYQDETAQFYPVKGDYASKRFINVEGKIVRRSGRDISMEYDLVRSGKTWRIYDIKIDGISMLRSYRSKFSSILSRRGNFDELIHQIIKMNKKT